MKNNELTLKIIILGSTKVGKTCLINQYFNKEFNDNPISTIGIDLQSKYFKFDNDIVKINFIDTAGQERFDSISSNYLKNVNGVLLVYDITNYDTFKKIDYWNNQIKNYNKNKYSIVLIGNKIDLNNQRVVNFNDGKNLSKRINCKFFETSARNNINVDEVFETISLLTYKFCKENKLLFNQSFSLNNQKEKKKSCC
jgi:small GTP-binding protein